ncbi:MAG TPA: hypothetical protein VK540_24125 [Polyangiaceae bacterium]|jgi:hypothetical protein|nr:hypothetical protein [Polyangiaceae bacterium]
MVRVRSLIRLGLVVHALIALALGGASTHLALVTFALATGRPKRWRVPRLAAVYARVTGTLFLISVVAGGVLYPTYRYQVRGLYLDRYAAWASNLFDMKEVLAALVAPLAFGLIVFGRRPLDEASPPEARLILHLCVAAVFGTTVFNVISGLVIVSIRSI